MAHLLLSDEYRSVVHRVRWAILHYRMQWTQLCNRMPVSTAQRRQQDLMRAFLDLGRVLHDSGFHAGNFAVLDTFRNALIDAARGTNEAEVLLDLFGFSVLNAPHQNVDAIKMAAAAKFLRHTYRVQRTGAQTFWVVSQPVAYTSFTTDEIWGVRGDYIGLRRALNDTNEMFTAQQRVDLFDAMERAKRWTGRALRKLQRAQNGDRTERDRVERWFGAPGIADTILGLVIDELQRGFRQMRDRISENQITFSDHPLDRAADTTMAFVVPREPFRAVYIKPHFFTVGQTQFSNHVYRAVTLLHELSHRVLDTEDHRYDFQQLAFNGTFNFLQAISNADSWAYYGADCSNHMNAGQIAWVKNGHAYHHHHP